MMRVVAALAGRDLRRFFRQPSRIVGSAAQPLILWAVLGAGFAGSFRPGGGAGVGYLQYFYPGRRGADAAVHRHLLDHLA